MATADLFSLTMDGTEVANRIMAKYRLEDLGAQAFGDGRIVIERAMFYTIKPGARPMGGLRAPPV